jgi:galactokinase
MRQFSKLFPDTPSDKLLAVRAPGRVNLIGEHIDYNDGFVCPMAIDKSTLILFTPRSDSKVRIHSISAKETAEFSIDKNVPKDGPGWSLYPKGAAEAMRRRANITNGMDAIVDSDVPLGGGLSSSASFEVATALALLTANRATMNPVDLALACQWAEHNNPGMPCGIMDQLISAMGQKGHALLIDCRDRTTRQVPLDDPNLRIVISNSNVKHELVAGEYTGRRHQCEAALAYIQKKRPDIRSWRDITIDTLEDSRMGMDPTNFRRARHVISETNRTAAFADALAARDYLKCGKFMYASHLSLKDDYAVSCPELDALVEIASTVPGVYGARMTGGGFGGCIVALTTADAVTPLTNAINLQYPSRSNNKQATTFSTTPSQGAHTERL